MEYLTDFKKMDFVAQMTLLTNAGQEKNKKYLTDLFQLYDEQCGDKTVDAMVEHSLRDILTDNEMETVAKLTSGTLKEKKLCVQIAGKEKFLSSIPILLDMVKIEKDIDVLTGVFIAMTTIKDPSFLDVFRRNVHHNNEVIAGLCIGMMGTLDDHNSENEL